LSKKSPENEVRYRILTVLAPLLLIFLFLDHGNQAATLTPSSSGRTTTHSTSATPAASRMPSSTISGYSRGCITAVERTHTIANSNVSAEFPP
jgi:hypothetical protein